MIDIETMLFQLLHITTTINELNFPPEIKKIFFDKLNILKCMIAEASNLMKLIKNTEVNERKKLSVSIWLYYSFIYTFIMKLLVSIWLYYSFIYIFII